MSLTFPLIDQALALKTPVNEHYGDFSTVGGFGITFRGMSKKNILISVAGLAALLCGFALYAYYDFTHKLSTMEIPPSAQIALKGTLGEAIFNGQKNAEVVSPQRLKGKTGLDALFAPVPADGKGQGLIAAYQKDPQKFKRYADMLDTAMNAKQVGDVLLQDGQSHPPRTSEHLPMEAKLKVDAWGSPFCIIPVGQKLAVISGGPSRLSCDALPWTREQIANSDKNMYAGPFDVVVVIASRFR